MYTVYQNISLRFLIIRLSCHKKVRSIHFNLVTETGDGDEERLFTDYERQNDLSPVLV